MGALLLIPLLLALAGAYGLCVWSVRPDALVRQIDDGPESRARRALD